ncbi:MAG: flagellar assembly protein FliW [Thermodesulfobacteriota bacterium]
MKTIETRFGQVTYDPKQVIRFPDGLIGFEQLRDFVVIPQEKSSALFCIQSVEESHLAFLFINPALFFPDYRVVPDDAIMEKLGIGPEDPYFILTTITFHSDDSVSVNLLAPVLYTPETDRAVQVVLDGSGYAAETPLPLKKTAP